MKLSFWTLGMPAWTNEQFVEQAASLGYGAIDIRCTRDGNLAPDASEAEIEALQRTFRAKGIEIASLLAYQKRGNGKDPVDWQAVEQDLVAHARLAKRLDNVPVRVTVGYTDPSTPIADYLANLGSATRTAMQEVPTSRFMFQNHAGSAKAEDLGALAVQIDSPRFGFGFSPDHCYEEHEDPLALAERYAPVIQQLHIADRKPTGDGHFAACWIGDGILPHGAILETLIRRGFDGWVSLKWERGGGSQLPEGDAVLQFYPGYMRKLALETPRQQA